MRKKKLIIRILIAIFAVAAIVILYFYNNPITKEIDMNVMGVQFRNNDPDGDFEEKQITIKGIYEHFLFRNKADTFSGQFSIDGYDITSGEHYTFRPITVGNRDGSILTYFEKDAFPEMHQQILGYIYCDVYFKELTIVTFAPTNENEGTFDYVNGITICAPAQDRAEAVETAKRVFINIGADEIWDGWNDWN